MVRNYNSVFNTVDYAYYKVCRKTLRISYGKTINVKELLNFKKLYLRILRKYIYLQTEFV